MALIVLDARGADPASTGVGRYIRALVPRLARATPTQRYLVLRRHAHTAPIAPDVPNVTEDVLPVPHDDFRNLGLGARAAERVMARHGEPSLFHALFHLVPVGLARVPVVVTLHDTVWIDHARASQTTLAAAAGVSLLGRIGIPHALHRAAHVIAVSRATAERARRWLGDTPCTVVPHGVDPAFFERSPRGDAPLGLRDPGVRVITAVGNDKRYKNLHTLVAAYARVRAALGPSVLCLVGPCEGLTAAIRASGLPPEAVVRTGPVPDAQVRAILGASWAFAFPSRVEGFGLPVLEAMAAGVPCVVSDREPMRSVAGEAALAFDPGDVHALADRLLALRDQGTRARCIEAGLAHAARHRWETTADATARVHADVLGLRGSTPAP